MGNFRSNVIGLEELRKIQSWTLRFMSSVLECAYGPKSADTMLVSKNQYNEYGKDGHRITDSLKFGGIVETKIHEDINLLTLDIAHEVGDGTTTVVLLSSMLFEAFMSNEKTKKILPRDLIARFKEYAGKLRKEILKRNQEFTPEMAYKVSMIATGGNEFVANTLKDLYAKFGNDLRIDIKHSPNESTYTREYAGLTLGAGMADPCYQNNYTKGTSEIHNPEIYFFEDAVDTPNIANLFRTIINRNFFPPQGQEQSFRCTPTVIVTKKIGYELDGFMNKIGILLNQMDPDRKVPLLVVSNISAFEADLYDDVIKLCGAKPIRKNVSPEKYKADAPDGVMNEFLCTPENLKNFAGKAELVISDGMKTSFINPALQFDENNETSKLYKNMIASIKNEISLVERETMDANVIGNLKRRLHSLQSNMVDFFVGGITAAVKESLYLQVEDAIISCRSAAANGVGCAASCEGLLASDILKNDDDIIAPIVAECYRKLVLKLYSTCMSEEEAKEKLEETFVNKIPFNLVTKEFDGLVLGSIMADIRSIEAIAEILGKIITCNQVVVDEMPAMINYNGKDLDTEIETVE